MKKTAAFVLVLAAVTLGVIVSWYLRPPRRTAAPAGSPAPAMAGVAPKPSVAIPDGKTLDFSGGNPVVKDSAADKAIIAQSVREMDEAAAGVTFGPAPKATTTDPKKPAPPE